MSKLTVITLQPCVILMPWVVSSLHPAISLFRTFGLGACRTRLSYLLPTCQVLSTWRLISSLFSLMNELSGTLDRMSSNKFPKSEAHQTLIFLPPGLTPNYLGMPLGNLILGLLTLMLSPLHGQECLLTYFLPSA